MLDLGFGNMRCTWSAEPSAEPVKKDREAAQPVKPEACGPRPWTSQEAERLRSEGGEGRRPPSIAGRKPRSFDVIHRIFRRPLIKEGLAWF